MASKKSSQSSSASPRVLILGAGFAGLRVANDLAKYSHPGASPHITVVDKGDIHLYTPDLYEIANSFNNEITDECLTRLKDSVALHIRDLVDQKKVTFLQDKVTEINPKKNSVTLEKEGKIAYDILVVTLGSQQNFYSIPGLKQFSYPVKTIKDALVINCHLDTFFHFLWKKASKDKITISIGGGGATGVQFSAEMCRYLDLLCQKYGYPRANANIQILQGANQLIGAGEKVSEYTLKRLDQKGVKVLLNHYITKAEPDKIHVKISDGPQKGQEKTIQSDILIWTGGVKVNPLVANSLGDKEKYGAIVVNKFMQSVDHENVYAAGDNTYFEDPNTHQTAPMLAQAAWEQGEIVAKNIIRSISGKKLKSFKIHTMPLIIPVGGQWGVVKIGRWIFKGRIGWILRRLTDLKYALSILPFWKALKKWHHDNQIFMKDDRKKDSLKQNAK